MIYNSHIERESAGYTQAALLYLAALDAWGRRDVTIMNMGGVIAWGQMPPWARDFGRLGAASNISRDVCITHHLPSTLAYAPLLGLKRNIGLTVVETSEVPKWLCADLERRFDCLIVPTVHNEQAFQAGGFKRQIRVLGHPMVPQWWTAPSALRTGDRPFTFYYIGNWNSRKNPELALRSYLRAFPEPGQANVAFALKLSAPRSFEGLIRQIIREETGTDERYDRDVWVFLEQWSEDKVRWLHDIGDCFVSAHRGEGWGLGPFQAALLGRAVVYTDYSAPVEYLNAEFTDDVAAKIVVPKSAKSPGASAPNGHYPVAFSMVPAGLQGGNLDYFYASRGQHLMWAEPSEEHLIARLQQAHHEAGQRQAERDRHAQWMREAFHPFAVGAGLDAILGQS